MTEREQPKLNIYHAVYYPDPKTYLVHCLNIEATSMLDALNSFKRKLPNIEPLYIFNIADPLLIHHKKE